MAKTDQGSPTFRPSSLHQFLGNNALHDAEQNTDSSDDRDGEANRLRSTGLPALR